MNYKEYQPLEDRCIILPIKSTEPEKTASGIITDTIKKETREGIVIAIGQGRYAMETGELVRTVLCKGDLVLIGANGGLPITIQNEAGENQEAVMLREGDVLCLIKKYHQNS
jgi:co-chaperonin GroES (HSP10)